MAEQRPLRLGDLQLKIMKVLWRSGPASVAEVHADLGIGQLAYTTVATMLRKMEARGLVCHHERGRRFIYEPAVSEEDVNRHTTADLVDRLFEGSLAKAVSHLLETHEVSLEELERLERLIQERKQRQ
jgi:predicted transcriptional regulator